MYQFNNQTISADEEGYLKNREEWRPEIANDIAKTENIELSERHWVVIQFLGDYFAEYAMSPAIRIMVKAMKKKYGADAYPKAALYLLFPQGPAKQATKIAGLPKPTGCI